MSGNFNKNRKNMQHMNNQGALTNEKWEIINICFVKPIQIHLKS